MKKLKDIFVSAVVINNNANNIINTLSNIQDTLIENYAHYEIIMIDTETSNKSFVEEMEGILTTIPKIRYIKLFDNPSKEVLFAAGIENAIGDIIITSTPEYYTKSNIINAVELCCTGIDTIIGLTKYDNLNKCLITNNINFTCVSRRIANAALTLPTYYNFIFYSLYNAGGKNTTIEIQKLNKNKHISVINYYNNKFELMLSNKKQLCKSTIKTYLMSIITILTILCGFNVFTLVKVIPLNFVLICGVNMFLLLFALFILSISFYINLYLIKKLLSENNQKQYTVMFEKHSSVMLNYNALNIRNNSISDSINLTQTGRDR